MGGRNAAVLTILIMLITNANTVTYVTKAQTKPFSHMTHMDVGNADYAGAFICPCASRHKSIRG
jgi:hypothetical protein